MIGDESNNAESINADSIAANSEVCENIDLPIVQVNNGSSSAVKSKFKLLKASMR
jgi:hypothetical protein